MLGVSVDEEVDVEVMKEEVDVIEVVIEGVAEGVCEDIGELSDDVVVETALLDTVLAAELLEAAFVWEAVDDAEEAAHVDTAAAAVFTYLKVSVSIPNQFPPDEKAKWHVTGLCLTTWLNVHWYGEEKLVVLNSRKAVKGRRSAHKTSRWAKDHLTYSHQKVHRLESHRLYF